MRVMHDAVTGKGWCLALWVHHFGFLFAPITKMNRLFNKNRKNSPEPSPQGVLPGIPTNIAAGSAGHQPDPNIGPEDEKNRSYPDPEADWPDLAVSLDGRSGGDSRIVFQDRMDEDQELPTSEAWTSGVVIGGTGRGNDSTSKCSRFLRLGPTFMFFSSSDPGNTGGGVSEPAEPSRGTCQSIPS